MKRGDLLKWVSNTGYFWIAKWHILLAFLFVHQIAFAQNEIGSPDVQNFDPAVYNANIQNWDIIQDKKGFIYSSNTSGLLEYDGVRWRLLTLPDFNAVRTVAVDEHNVKWYGANNDFGYLAPDSAGLLQLKSLKNKIPETHPLKGHVWSVFITDAGVTFSAGDIIYTWKDGVFTVVPPIGQIHTGFQIEERIFFRLYDKGLFELKSNALVPIKGGEIFNALRIYSALPYGEDAVLFATREAGIFIYENNTIRKFDNEIDEYIIENRIYSGIQLPDSTYAITTLRGGVIFMDQHGNKMRTITTTDGILNNEVYGIALDAQNGIWLAQQTGISRVDPFLPYTNFADQHGISGTVLKIARHNGTLYVATFSGLFKFSVQNEDPVFKRIEEINSGFSSMLSVKNDLLVASDDGTYVISNNGVKKLNDLQGLIFHPSSADSNRIFIGHETGLATLYYSKGAWQHEYELAEIKEDVLSIAEHAGDLWLGTRLNGVIKLDISSLQNNSITVHRYNDENNFKTGWTHVYSINSDLWVRTAVSVGPLYRYVANSDSFVLDNNFGQQLNIASGLAYPVAQQGSNLLVNVVLNPNQSVRYSATKNKLTGQYVLTQLVDQKLEYTYRRACWDENNILWLAGETLIRYDLTKKYPNSGEYKTYIRKVILGQDSILYGGSGENQNTLTLPHSNASIRFQFSSPNFSSAGKQRYQFFLKGFDDDWSEWSDETQKDYTNLPEGDYQFLTKAKDVFGRESDFGEFVFAILPPWYRTFWAYGLYILLAIAGVAGIVQWRSQQLKHDKKKLERLVEENTTEIRHQAEKLKELDKIKSRFFANISHEFRTPLTLILGPLEEQLKKGDTKITKELSVMHRNAKRLEKLIDQLLDLSRIESSQLKLLVAHDDVIKYLRVMMASFSSLAEQKGIGFTMTFSSDTFQGYFDADKLEKIVYNLLSNAFKFSCKGGQVNASVSIVNEALLLEVDDTGLGIAEEELDQIFDRFYRSLDGAKSDIEGVGIGLALTKELVKLHGGNISVQSDVGNGSTFTVTLPLDKNSYKNADISEDHQLELDTAEIQYTYTEKQEASIEESKPMLLIVEDSDDLREYIGETLKEEFNISYAINGKEGLDLAINQIPDLVISDLMMPVMDGLELCKKLKTTEATSHIPVILLTARANIESRLEGLSTGADAYLTKPFNADELKIRVTNLIEQRVNLRKHYSRTVLLKPKDIVISSMDEVFLDKVMKVVETNLDNSDFSVEQFQTEIGMSRMQLHRKLKALTGHSTTEFVRHQRLIRAAEMLKKNAGNISDICYAVGFSNLSYFTQNFKQQFGIVPSEYASSISE